MKFVFIKTISVKIRGLLADIHTNLQEELSADIEEVVINVTEIINNKRYFYATVYERITYQREYIIGRVTKMGEKLKNRKLIIFGPAERKENEKKVRDLGSVQDKPPK